MSKKNGKDLCELCEDKPVRYPRIGLCVNCYAALHYWMKKKPGDVIKRQHKLEVYQKRMELISGKRTNAGGRK